MRIKITIFTFICAVIMFVTSSFFESVPFAYILTMMLAIVASGIFLCSLCLCFYKKPERSTYTSTIVIFLFATLSVMGYFLKSLVISYEIEIKDYFMYLVVSYMWIVCLLACVFSLLVLIGKLIFTSNIESRIKKTESNTESITESENTITGSLDDKNDNF